MTRSRSSSDFAPRPESRCEKARRGGLQVASRAPRAALGGTSLLAPPHTASPARSSCSQDRSWLPPLELARCRPLHTMPVDKERQAVIVGVGRFTQRPKPVEECVTPVGMFAEAARRAAVDAAAASGPDALLADLVAVGCPMMFLEMRWSAAFQDLQEFPAVRRAGARRRPRARAVLVEPARRQRAPVHAVLAGGDDRRGNHRAGPHPRGRRRGEQYV